MGLNPGRLGRGAQLPTAVPRVAPGVSCPHLQQARSGHTWRQKKFVRGHSSRHICHSSSASWPTQPCPRARNLPSCLQCNESHRPACSPNPGVRPLGWAWSGGCPWRGIAVGGGCPTARAVPRLSVGPRPFGPASFAVCPFGFLPESYWIVPLFPIVCRSCLYLQGIGPLSLPYVAVWLTACLGQAQSRSSGSGHRTLPS